MTYKNIHVDLYPERLIIRVLIGNEYFVVNQDSNHGIDIFDWSKDKIYSCVRDKLELFFGRKDIPDYSLMY